MPSDTKSVGNKISTFYGGWRHGQVTKNSQILTKQEWEGNIHRLKWEAAGKAIWEIKSGGQRMALKFCPLVNGDWQHE